VVSFAFSLQSRPTRKFKMFGTKENHKRDLQKRPQERPTEETYKTKKQTDTRSVCSVGLFCI